MSFGVQFFTFIIAWAIWNAINSSLARRGHTRRGFDGTFGARRGHTRSGFNGTFGAFSHSFPPTVSPLQQALGAGQHQLALFFASARLGAHVARADGVVAREEIGAIGAYFSAIGFPQQSLSVLLIDVRYFLQLDDQEGALSEAAHVVLQTAASQSELEAVAFMVSMVACADGILTAGEKSALEQIRVLLGLSAIQMAEALQSARASFRSAHNKRGPSRPSTNEHLQTLGLSPGASKSEIRTAYLELARKYHPDKVEHMGSEFRSAAEERFKSIQGAYEALKA